MTVSSQNVGKLHHYADPQFNTEFDRIYDFLANAKFPDNSVNGRKLKNGSVPETKLILPLRVTAVIHPDPTPNQPGYLVGDTLTITTTSYTVLDKDRTILADDDAAGGAMTIILPAVAQNNHRELTIKKIGATAVVTVDGNGPETIDEVATQDILFQYDAMQLVCDGVQWWIV